MHESRGRMSNASTSSQLGVKMDSGLTTTCTTVMPKTTPKASKKVRPAADAGPSVAGTSNHTKISSLFSAVWNVTMRPCKFRTRT